MLLHNALYHWLGERVELSMSVGDYPEEAARRARESALAKIQDQDMLSEFAQAVAVTCTNVDALAEAPPDRGKQSLLFDLQGPIDLLGPEEIDSLLADLTTSDSPLPALEALTSDVHLLEDLCYGPTWPQLCDALGRLICLPAAVAAAASPTQPPPAASQAAAPPPPVLPRQQQLLLTVLQELASSVAASSPAHAAELLDAMAPHLTALVLHLELPQKPQGSGSGSGMLNAAATLDPFAVGLMRVAHRLLAGLAAEFHLLPPSCAALAARAVCDVVRAGLARGAPSPAPPPLPAAAAARREGDETVAAAVDLDLSALDLLVLLDPELRWWQRLCAATHATQRLADAVAATHLAAGLEAALEAWAAAAAAAAAAAGHGGGGGSGGGSLVGGVSGTAAGGRSPTHLLACTALLGGMVRANNLALVGCEVRGCDGGADGGGVCHGRSGAVEAAAAAPAGSQPPQQHGRPVVVAVSSAAVQQQRVRLQRMLGHLLSCFCVVSDKPWLFRANDRAPKAAVALAGPTDTAGSSSATITSGHGSVFLHLATDVLDSAAALGKLSLLAPVGGGGGGCTLTPLLQAMLRAAALTASAATTAAQGPEVTMGAAAVAAAEAEVWLAAAARVLGAAADQAAPAAASGSGGSETASGPPAASEALCALLRHIAGRVRGCAAAAATAAPAWALPVVRAAVALSAASPASAAALQDLYDTLHAVLSAKAPPRRSAAGPRSSSLSSSSPTRSATGGAGAGGVRGSGAGQAGVSLLDILGGGGGLGPERAPAPSASLDPHGASAEEADLDDLDDLEVLAAAVVMSHSRIAGVGPASAEPPAAAEPLPAALLPLPPALRRPLFLECAARLLCEEYDAAAAGGLTQGAEGGGGGGLCARRAAAKRRVAWRAEALARCCPAGQQALVAAGFARRVLDDVTAVLRSAEYESPYLEPLPYADPLAGLSEVLCGVLCWPGLLRPPEGEGQGAAVGGGSGGEAAATCGLGSSLEQRHRQAVLAMLQELVTWLDPRGAQSEGLPPADAAAVSVQVFAALVAADPAAGFDLERDTNIRWYLQSLCETLPQGEEREEPGGARSGRAAAEGEKEQGPARSGAAAPGAGAGRRADEPPRAPPPPPQPQSDMLLDLARTVLQAIASRTASSA